MSLNGYLKKHMTFALLICIALLGGCATPSTTDHLLESSESQVMLRQMQTRAFDTLDKVKTMRSVLSTLQDLDFLIENADANLGSVTAKKIYRNVTTKITVTVREGQGTQMLVRANAQYGLQPVTNPVIYRDFFTALEKAMFLTAQQVD